MKNGFKFARLAPLFLALAALLTVSAAQAAEKPYNLKIGENETLLITAPDGTLIASLPTATVGKRIQHQLHSFIVSYGKDANANLSVIVTPDPEHPGDLTVTFNNREISMDRASVVTMTLTNGGQNVTVDAGYTGHVTSNGQTLTGVTNSDGTQATTTVASNTSTGSSTGANGQASGATAQQAPDATGAGNVDGFSMQTALAPAINNNQQAVFSSVTNPADTTDIGRGP